MQVSAPPGPVTRARPLALRAQSDDRLIELLQAGVEPAFVVLVGRYRGPLLRYCTQIVSPERAEDVVQATLVKAYQAIAAGHIQHLRPWLYHVAHNGALDALRDRALTHVELDDRYDGVERPDQAFERAERLRETIAAVKGLPARQRDALVLRELEGRTYSEIAGAMGLTGGAVRQLLRRARVTLRAGVSAVTPIGLLLRSPWQPATGQAPLRIAELASGTALPAVGAAQACTTAIATCSVVAAVVSGGPPAQTINDGRESDATRAAAIRPASMPKDVPRLATGGPAEAVRQRPDPTEPTRRKVGGSQEIPRAAPDRPNSSPVAAPRPVPAPAVPKDESGKLQPCSTAPEGARCTGDDPPIAGEDPGDSVTAADPEPAPEPESISDDAPAEEPSADPAPPSDTPPPTGDPPSTGVAVGGVSTA